MQQPQQSILSTAAQEVNRQRTRSRVASTGSARVKVSASSAFRQRGHRGPSSGTNKQHQQNVLTVLQRRDRLRIYEDGEDVTPRHLVHPQYASLDERRTAFDAIGLGQSGSRPASRSGSHGGSRTTSILHLQPGRPSLDTISSYSSIYTLDEFLAAKHSDSVSSSGRVSAKDSQKNVIDAADDEDVPSQFHVPRFDSRDFFSLDDRVTITLKETETDFIFELPQLTEDAQTAEGQALIEENEKYRKIMAGAGRKTLDAETQTAQRYTKTRSTYVGREERMNHATFVNNWVMYDTYRNEEAKMSSGEPFQETRFKFPESKPEEHRRRQLDDQLAAIGSRVEYEDAARVTLRILASKNYEEAQKRFAGLRCQDPGDLNLELVYELDLLWRHTQSKVNRRPAITFKWNPVNASLLAVGYGALNTKSISLEEVPEGLVLIWCAKNPSEPDRVFEFNSAVSDLDWSTSRPNLLAIGFYDGVVRVIDVSKKQLTVVLQSDRRTSPSYDPHWQVQWWPMSGEPFGSHQKEEQLFTSNQDGRVFCYSTDTEFAAQEILYFQRIDGKIPGVARINHCLGHAIPISRSPGALLLRKHPTQQSVYIVGTEEGCVYRCAMTHPHTHLESLLAHDGPIYSLEYSPFCTKLILTCGADWCTRIWAEGLDEPLLTFGTRMACVTSAAWSPRNSTIFASAVANEICIWDIRRKSYRPASTTRIAPQGVRLLRIEFTRSGEQLVASDEQGTVYVYGVRGMPLPAFDPTRALVDAIEKSLLTKPELLRRLKKLGPPFGVKTE